MDPVTAVELGIMLLPYIEKAGVDLYQLIEGVKQGKTREELIEECVKKRDDLPSLDFGILD